MYQTTTMSDLPQEIIDHIIDEFHHSAKELKNLSLVGKSWLPRARYHLFRYLVFTARDLQAIRDDYACVKRKASPEFAIDPRNYLSNTEKRFLHSPLAQNPQTAQSFLSSIADSLSHVRGLRLLSNIQLGALKRLTAETYFHQWLGYGDRDHASNCLLRRGSSSDEDFRDRQKARWDAIDLPWRPGPGIHALPFRNLRYINVQWSVFSWTPPSIEHDIVGPMNPDRWPGYQLATLIKANADSLDDICIYQYPGYRLEQYNPTTNGDALLDLLARHAPKLRSLTLGGFRWPFSPHLYASKEDPSSRFLSSSRALYPSGEKVPHVRDWDHDRLSATAADHPLERLYLQGFDAESTILLEDALLNHGAFSLTSLTHLALSVMPEDYDYMFMFSNVRWSLTHLTLDLDETILDLNLKFHLFPKLEVLQLMIHSIYYTEIYLSSMIRSLSHNDYVRDDSALVPAVQRVQLMHFAFEPGTEYDNMHHYLHIASVDEGLETLVSTPLTSSESMGRSQVDMITMDIPEDVLAEALPLTFRTGCLKNGKTDYWWFRPAYLQ
ncbi:hypothetical protein C8R42DRAFT_686369 [Lentinula raphanica]|nr:hypothetical protein C8R42DRAFT_686369 [Lentinula raphanica]